MIHKIKNSYDSVTDAALAAKYRITQKIDSLTTLRLVAPGLQKKLDSINAWKEDKLRVLQSKIDLVNKKLGVKAGNIGLPTEVRDINGELQQLTDKIQLDRLGTPDLAGDIAIPSSNIDLDPNKLTGVVTENLPMNGAQLSDVKSQISGVPNALKTQAESAVGVDAVRDEIAKSGEVTAMMSGASEEAVKEQLKSEVQRQAVNHFAGQEKQLEAAMETLSKYKLKYERVTSIADLPKKRPNPMKGKPFLERSVAGVFFQVQRKGARLVDVNPYMGYKFNHLITGGLGWNHRIAYDWDTHSFPHSQFIFGPRAFAQITIRKGFSGRVEGEYMNSVVPTQFSSGRTDEKGREWVFSPMVGITKHYKFIKRVNGTMAVMYNIYDPHHRSPYANRINIRFGFEIGMKRNGTRAAETPF